MMASNATKDVWVKRSGTWFVIMEDIMGKYHVSLRLKKKTSYQMLPKVFFHFTFTGDFRSSANDATFSTKIKYLSGSHDESKFFLQPLESFTNTMHDHRRNFCECVFFVFLKCLIFFFSHETVFDLTI